MGDNFGTVRGYLQYCGGCSGQWGITSVQWGIASVLWRLFSAVGDSFYFSYSVGNPFSSLLINDVTQLFLLRLAKN